MSTPTFAETYNLIAFLEKPIESDRFEKIIDFLNANPIKYALTIQALVDRKNVVINVAFIRRDLILDDAKGTACLPYVAIFEELARMCAKTSAWNEFSSTMASAIICLANQKFNFSKYILEKMVKNLEAGVKFFMFPRFIQVFVNHQIGDMSHHKGIFVNPSLTKKKHTPRRKQRKETEVSQDESPTEEHIPTPSHDLLTSGEDRLQLNELIEICIKLSDMVLSLEQTKTNQAAKIKKLKKRVEKLEGKKKKRTHRLKRLYKVGLSAKIVSSDEEDQGRVNDQDLFGVHDLDNDEVFVDVTIGENVEQDTKVTEKTLMEIKAAKPKAKGVTIQEPSEFRKRSLSQPPQAKDKEVARKLEAEIKAKMDEKERITKEKNEADISMIKEWDDVQATIDVDRQRKYFATKRVEEIKNKPLTKTQQKSLMCTYMKNMEGFKQKDFKEKSFDDIKKIFDKVYKRVNTFVDMNTKIVEESLKKTQAKVTEGSSKRAGEKLKQESAKKQKLDEEVQAKVADDDTTELKRCLEIVSEDDDDVTIEATPLSSKSPTIVDYKIYKEWKKSYFKIIRADGNSQNYLTFGTMFKNFNREDLEVLKSIVKEMFKKTKPMDDMDNLLFQTLKTMFEHHVKDIIWKYQQRAVKVNNWKLFDSCGVYCVTTKNMMYYLLVKKMYQFTNNILHQL
nr:hypothetical protein [Tanacetum cinerariifolium]